MRTGGRFRRFLAMDDLDTIRWSAVQTRDRSKDEVFVYAVRTTGIYCRPSCAARRPRRENVVFFSTPAAAIAEGFRACRRCHPDQRRTEDHGTASVLAVCRWLEHPHEDHDPAPLAARVGWSKRHLQRRFAETVGVSMSAYRRAMQAERVRAALRSGANVTDAVFDAGYGSVRAFYEHGAPRLGMNPAEYAASGRGHHIRYTVMESTLGWILIAATDLGICAVRIGTDPHELIVELADEFGAAILDQADRELADIGVAVRALSEGMGDPDLPIDVRGTAFQVQVWEALRQIPAGTTISYSELAAAIGRPTALRAVASACAANPAALVIPCHRVVQSDGAIGGYRWGRDTKESLLAAERRADRSARRTK